MAWLPLVAAGVSAVGGLVAGSQGLGANQRDAKQYNVDNSAFDPYGGPTTGLPSNYGQQYYNQATGPYDAQLKDLGNNINQMQSEMNTYASQNIPPNASLDYAMQDPRYAQMQNALNDMQGRAQQLSQARDIASTQAGQQVYVNSVEQSGTNAQNQYQGQGQQILGQGQQNYTNASNLMNQAAQGNAPSVAQLQSQQQMGQANQQALGVAASARGGAASALASRAAIQQMGQNDQALTQNNAILRAKEMEDARAGLGGLAAQGMTAGNQLYGLGEQARQNSVASGLAARGLYSDASQAREQLKAQVQKGFDERNLLVGQQKAQAGTQIFQGVTGAIAGAAGAGAKG